MVITAFFLQEKQNLQVLKLLQKLVGKNGIKIYMRIFYPLGKNTDVSEKRNYGEPTADIEIEAGKNLSFLQKNRKMIYSVDIKSSPTGAISIDYEDRKIIISTYGCKDTKSNFFVSAFYHSCFSGKNINEILINTLNIEDGNETVVQEKFEEEFKILNS